MKEAGPASIRQPRKVKEGGSRTIRQPFVLKESRRAGMLRGIRPRKAPREKGITMASDTTTPAAPRNARIELLRLCAIAGIALFHTLQPWFAEVTGTGWLDVDLEIGTAGLTCLGFVNLLGSWGNSVFFMISGYFLLPRAIRAAATHGFYPAQLKAAARRSAPLLASVAFYTILSVAVELAIPFGGLLEYGPAWLFSSLEFIWVYLVILFVTPIIASAWRRLRKPETLVWALAAATLAISFYVAFFSPGDADRGLLEWRKLLSAATYLCAYLVGGRLGEKPAVPEHPHRNLVLVALACVAVEAALAETGNLTWLAASSFKSTSALSFALAIACVVAATAPRAATSAAPALSPHAAALVTRLAQSVLGFYIAQALFYELWEIWSEAVLAHACYVAGIPVLLIAAVIFSAVLLAVIVAFDQAVRIPVLRRLHLAR